MSMFLCPTKLGHAVPCGFLWLPARLGQPQVHWISSMAQGEPGLPWVTWLERCPHAGFQVNGCLHRVLGWVSFLVHGSFPAFQIMILVLILNRGTITRSSWPSRWQPSRKEAIHIEVPDLPPVNDGTGGLEFTREHELFFYLHLLSCHVTSPQKIKGSSLQCSNDLNSDWWKII